MSRVRDWLAWRLFWVSCRLNHIRVATEVRGMMQRKGYLAVRANDDAKHKGPQS